MDTETPAYTLYKPLRISPLEIQRKYILPRFFHLRPVLPAKALVSSIDNGHAVAVGGKVQFNKPVIQIAIPYILRGAQICKRDIIAYSDHEASQIVVIVRFIVVATLGSKAESFFSADIPLGFREKGRFMSLRGWLIVRIHPQKGSDRRNAVYKIGCVFQSRQADSGISLFQITHKARTALEFGLCIREGDRQMLIQLRSLGKQGKIRRLLIMDIIDFPLRPGIVLVGKIDILTKAKVPVYNAFLAAAIVGQAIQVSAKSIDQTG